MEAKSTSRWYYLIFVLAMLGAVVYLVHSCQGGPMGFAQWYRLDGSAYVLEYKGDRSEVTVRVRRPGAEPVVLGQAEASQMPRVLGEHGSDRLLEFAGPLNEPIGEVRLLSLEGEEIEKIALAEKAFPLQKIQQSVIACKGFDNSSRQMNGLVRFDLDGSVKVDFGVDATFGYYAAERAPRLLVWGDGGENDGCRLYNFDTGEPIETFAKSRGFLSPDGETMILADPGEKTVLVKTVEKSLGDLTLKRVEVDRASFRFTPDSSILGVSDRNMLHLAALEPFELVVTIEAPGEDVYDPAQFYPLPGRRIVACRVSGGLANPKRVIVVYDAEGNAIFEKVLEPVGEDTVPVFAMMPDEAGRTLYLLHGDTVDTLELPMAKAGEPDRPETPQTPGDDEQDGQNR